jgi:hypothetical protein
MKTIDLSLQKAETSKSPITDWLKKTFSGGAGQAELDAQDQVAMRLERALSDEFTMIREVKLPGLDTTIPIALVGPPGIYVLYASAVKGTFRARGDAWLKLDNSGNMRNASPNLPNRTRLYAEAIRKFLSQNNHPNAEIEPVLLFSQPEAFVENIKAPIRMVMCDGIDSYGASLRLINPLLGPEEYADIVRLLSNPEGKLNLADQIAAAEEEVGLQPVIMPSEEPPAEQEAPDQQEPDFITEEVMRSAFIEQHPEPEPIPIPPVIEEAVEQAPSASFSIAELLARTRMKTWQITFLGVVALFDLLFICLGFGIVIFRTMR